MVTTTRRSNIDSPARWDAALVRAEAKNIQVWQDSTTGDFLALSSDATKLYTVRWFSCTCAAAEAGDPVCVHRAAFRAMCRAEDAAVERLLADEAVEEDLPANIEELLAAPSVVVTAEQMDAMVDGTLVLSIGEDGELAVLPAPAAIPARPCGECLSSGHSRMYTGGGLNDYRVARCHCAAGDVHRVRDGYVAA